MQQVMSPIGGQRTLTYAYGSAARDIRVIESELASGRPMSAKQWQFLHTRLGQTIGQMEEAGQRKGLDRAKQLYAAMYDDLERAAENEVRPRTGTVTGGTERLPNQGGPDIATSFHADGPTELPTDTVAEARPVNRPTGIYAPGIEGQERRQIGQPTAPESREVGFATPGPNEHSNQVPGRPTRTVGPEPTPETPREQYTAPRPEDIQVPGTGAGKLLRAKQIYLREKSVEDIHEYIEKAMKSLRGQGGDQQFNAAEVIRKLKDDQFYEKAFTAAERKDIEKTLHVLNTAPALPTPSSINAGSKRMNQRIAGATAGAASGAYIGSTVGQPAAGAVIGGLAGFGARDVADMASNLAFAMKTDTGRAMVKELAKTKKGFFTPRNAAVLSAYAAALRNQPDTEMTRE
jgi:outer membrane lipoprotein SlyB